MRNLLPLLLSPLLLGDPTVATALKKVGEKKSYAFTITTKTEGGDLGQAARAMEQPVTGAWEKGETLVAKLGRAAETARRGAKGVYKTPETDEWLTKEEFDKAAAGQQGRGGALVDLLAGLQAPHAEWALAMRRVASLAKQKDVEDGCVVYVGALTKDAAKELVTSLLPSAPANNNNGGGRPGAGGGVPGGRFGTPGGGGGGGQGEVKEAAGTVKFLVGKEDELPHALVYTVTFKTMTGGGQQRRAEEIEVTLTRTLKLTEFDSAKAEIPEGAKKKL